ncbi:UNVERIFIED_CONTAM: Endoglucanase 16 [Sesamum radiatum]|uniref:cellulase n=1 Tax=Sesamum radiatum TaxID=300843 RepID=A0AAW2KXV9_SESRA
MITPRTVLKIDRGTPGTEIAAETCAALAAASMVFRRADHAYARRLLNRAKVLFFFAKKYKGTYDGECPFYCSNSGYNFYMEGQKDLYAFKEQADSFVCSILPDSPYHQVYISPGGLLHLRDGANTQYVTGTAFLFSEYSDLLAKHKQQVICGDKKYGSDRLMAFAKQQMDYILSNNPRRRSYMVGFSNKPPTQAHHRGSCVPKCLHMKKLTALTGAIVGGPDKNDNFEDKRADSSMTEPTTYINSLAVGVLAKLARHSHAR